ncbi:hypothetical protein Tsubulata_037194 [Turnera subulata]|uniref:Uncharacterized protein n=1 Tax=Turnera subulata TaxID=218843 RepID=A0A9Q0FWB7_9ROSI|nr:hypothetical protein Tsubulata_037194 [Turnera subulata]
MIFLEKKWDKYSQKIIAKPHPSSFTDDEQRPSASSSDNPTNSILEHGLTWSVFSDVAVIKYEQPSTSGTHPEHPNYSGHKKNPSPSSKKDPKDPIKKPPPRGSQGGELR